MLYFVVAHDGTDPEAPERRRRVRPEHLEAIKPSVESGTVQLGGAILDDDGGMIGSILLIEAEDEAAARHLIDNDIYSRERVWQKIEIYPFRRAV
jgi:uncharacterized protein